MCIFREKNISDLFMKLTISSRECEIYIYCKQDVDLRIFYVGYICLYQENGDLSSIILVI